MPNGSNHPRSAIDVEAELAYWMRALPECDFHDGEPFSRYVKSFKFAYDAFVQHQGRPLDELWVALEERYKTRMPEGDRLPWPSMKHLLQAVWNKLDASAPGNATPAGSRRSPETNDRPSRASGAVVFGIGPSSAQEYRDT